METNRTQPLLPYLAITLALLTLVFFSVLNSYRDVKRAGPTSPISKIIEVIESSRDQMPAIFGVSKNNQRQTFLLIYVECFNTTGQPLLRRFISTPKLTSANALEPLRYPNGKPICVRSQLNVLPSESIIEVHVTRNPEKKTEYVYEFFTIGSDGKGMQTY